MSWTVNWASAILETGCTACSNARSAISCAKDKGKLVPRRRRDGQSGAGRCGESVLGQLVHPGSNISLLTLGMGAGEAKQQYEKAESKASLFVEQDHLE